MESQISHRKFRHFLYHLARANQKLGEIDQSRAKLGKQFEKTKTVSLDREKKVVIENSFEKLQRQMNELLQKEGFLTSQHAEETKQIRELTTRVIDLEAKLAQANRDREVIENLKLSLKLANQKLEGLLKIEEEREKKIARLEESIRGRAEEQKTTANKRELLKQLEELEDKYYQLRYSGQHDDLTLAKISDRISLLKKQLEV